MTRHNTAVVVVVFQKQWTEPGFYHRMLLGVTPVQLSRIRRRRNG